MAKTVSTEAVEQLVAAKLGLDLTRVVKGSVGIEAGPGDFERVTWTGLAVVDRGFMSEVFNELAGR